MHLNDPVDQDTSHSLGDLRLVVHVLVLRLVHHFGRHKVLHNISCKFSDVLRVWCILSVAFVHSILEMNSAPSLEVVIDRLKLFVESLCLLPFIFLLDKGKILFTSLDILDSGGGAARILALGPHFDGEV